MTAKLTWKTERRKIGSLIEWEKNPRRLTEEQAAQLAKSIDRFGYVEEIVVNTDGQIIGGHQRRRTLLAQAMVTPEAEVDVRIPSRKLSEKECSELAIRLNKNTGEWDFDALIDGFETEELLDMGFPSYQITSEDPGEESGATIERIETDNVKTPPTMAWVLVGVPLDRFGQVQELVAKIELVAGIVIRSTH